MEWRSIRRANNEGKFNIGRVTPILSLAPKGNIDSRQTDGQYHIGMAVHLVSI